MSTPISVPSHGPRFVLPFLAGDLVLLVSAAVVFGQGHRPMTGYEVAAFGACVAIGAGLGVWPFLLRQRTELQLAENAQLGDAIAQIQGVVQVGDRVAHATGQWQTAQEHADRTVEAARQISERLTGEMKEFMAFAEKANDAERNHLRLEVEKFRRAEADWLQVAVRLLDHVFALYSAGLRSGQAQLIQQLGMFQNACRETTRRIGLLPFEPEPGTPYDAKIHQLPDPNAPLPNDPVIAHVVATGFSFQGQLLRPALVVLRPAGSLPGGLAAGAGPDPTAPPFEVPPPTLVVAEAPPMPPSVLTPVESEVQPASAADLSSAPEPISGPKPGTIAPPPELPAATPPAKPGGPTTQGDLL